MTDKTNIRIIQATEDDIPRISEIEQESNTPPWTHGSLLNELYNEDSFFIVADKQLQSDIQNESNQHYSIIGYALLRRIDNAGEILKVAVEKSHRRTGIGELLIKSCLDYAKNNSMESVILEVRKSNTPAIKLYDKHGFKPIRTRKDYYTNPLEDAIIMKRNKST